ncbi:MAG: hypothetical protein ACOX7B_14720 [Christensenellales bacterium]|jgi:hypothetical protein
MKNSLWELLGIQHAVAENTQMKSPEEKLPLSEKSSAKDIPTARLNAIHLWINSQSSRRKRNRLKKAAQILESILAVEASGSKATADNIDFYAIVRRARQRKSVGFFQARSINKLIRHYETYGQAIASQSAKVHDAPEKPQEQKSLQTVQKAATEEVEDEQTIQMVSGSIDKPAEKVLDAEVLNPEVLTEKSISDLLPRIDADAFVQSEDISFEQGMVIEEGHERKCVDVSTLSESVNNNEDIRTTDLLIEGKPVTLEEASIVEETKMSLSNYQTDKTDSSTQVQVNHASELCGQIDILKEINYEETFAEFNIAEDIAAWPRDDKVWTLGEWALLLDWHLKYVNLTAGQRKDQIRAFSHLLRTAAKEVGFPIDEKYRNEAGISSQYGYLTSYISGSKGSYKYAINMEQVVKLFRHRRSEYDLLLSAFQERLGLKKKFQNEEDEANEISFDIIDFIEEIDEYLELNDKENEIDTQEQKPAVSTVTEGDLVSVPDEIVNALHLLYPDKRYPSSGFMEDFIQKSKLPHTLIEQHMQALLHPKWMAKIGFRPIESEMKTMPGKVYHAPGYEALEPVLQQAFYTQPLLGNITPTPEQRTLLFKSAMDILNQALRHKKPLSPVQRDILVLETVMLLQRWNQHNDEHQDTTFWEYICTQYGLRYDVSDFSTSKTYSEFRTTIALSLRRHNRLMARKGKRYYTTMLTQAMAPKEKFFDLFEQIFSFYAKNLQYQCIADDPAFTAFSLAMKRRFDSKQAFSDESVYIKSVQSSSAIELLFTRPEL